MEETETILGTARPKGQSIRKVDSLDIANVMQSSLLLMLRAGLSALLLPYGLALVHLPPIFTPPLSL